MKAVLLYFIFSLHWIKSRIALKCFQCPSIAIWCSYHGTTCIYYSFKHAVLNPSSHVSVEPWTISRRTVKCNYKLHSLSAHLHFPIQWSTHLGKRHRSKHQRTLIITIYISISIYIVTYIYSISICVESYYISKIHLQPKDKKQEWNFYATRKQGVTQIISSTSLSTHRNLPPVFQ